MNEQEAKILENLRDAMLDYSKVIKKEMHEAVEEGKTSQDIDSLIKSIAYFTATFSKVCAAEKNDACKVSNCYYLGE